MMSEIIDDIIDYSRDNLTDNVSEFYSICCKILEEKTYQLINGFLVDMQTANMFKLVWESINQITRGKTQTFYDKGLSSGRDSLHMTGLIFRKFWRVVGT